MMILPLIAAGMILIMMTGCMPSWSNAQNHLKWALNPDDDSFPTTDELLERFSPDKATFSDKLWGRTCIVEFPVTDADTRPQEDVSYVGVGSGTTMTFSLSTQTDSLPHSIGVACIEWHEDQWGFADDSTDSRSFTDTCFVESRGKGVYSLFNPEEYPQRKGMLLFVYPGADSILIHRGSEETKRVFKVK